MITFLDENDVEYGALATIKVTNAVNGERSLTGTIASGDYVLSNIERGWRLRFDDEYYVVTYAKPVDEGRDVQVEFDAVHQFFWDFDKSSVYDQLSDGSHTFRAYLDFIFKDSGYSYTVDSALNVYAFEKQSFGFKKRLTLFNDIITSTGVEFQVNGKVVRILAKVGTDLSTVVRKNFNMNELTIEKNIGDFVTYQKGFGAYFDEEDHSKGRLEVEYTSPLASVYGKLEAEPLVDERYSQSSSLLAVLKENVDNSYTISVSLDMEDLTRAGYKYKQPVAGDYIMAINETLDFQEKIRIVSFTSEYDVQGILVKHEVTCNDIGSVKKLSASYTHTQHQAANAEANANTAYEYANKALISADGKNTNYYGDSFPVDNPKGTLKKGDLLFLTVGDTVKQYYWNGADWVINPVLDDVEAFKEQIAEDLKDVPNREEFENKIAEELANSKAEIETQIESAKTQAESNAKEYADTINQETAKVAELANAAAGEIKADLVNVKNNLTSTSLVANNAQAAADAAKRDLANVASELNTAKQDLTDSLSAVNTKVDSAKAELTQTKQELTTVSDDLSQAKTDLQNAVSAVDTKATNLKSDLSQAKQDLNSQAQQLQAQANAQSELTKRVSSVEKTANGTKTTVSELSKTVAQNGKDITSITARTKVVEDDLSGTKTTLSQVQTTANSASQKTATLETGLNGLSAKFDSLKVGSVNLLKNSKSFTGSNITGASTILNETYQGCAVRYLKSNNSTSGYQEVAQFSKCVYPELGGEYVASFWAKGSGTFTTYFYGSDGYLYVASTETSQGRTGTAFDGAINFTLAEDWQRYWIKYKLKTEPASATSVAKHFLIRHIANGKEEEIWLAGVQLEEGNIATDYSPNEADLEQKVAEYKQNADQNYASLQTTVQNLDGTVQHNKTVADQTAQGFKTRIESLETYKNGESERANAYFQSAKTETAKQLTAERTAIANNYVAKSTYTSDVTGIRNDLTATTTTANTIKTNLANYQASNDRAVANLQSNLQTANGNISSLKTKVEAVPGQITSAVSAVEGKIPTEIGSTNLLRKTAVNTENLKLFGKENATVSVVEKDRHQVYKLVVSGSNNAGAYFNGNIDYYNLVKDRNYTFSFWVLTNKDKNFNMNSLGHIQAVNNNSDKVGNDQYHQHTQPIYSTSVIRADIWTKVWCTFKATSNSFFRPYFWYLTAGDEIYIYDMMLNEGKVPLSYTPAPEDTISQINAVSSELSQTKDGITLLATKTELNTAKNDLQSGISTATNKANAAQNTANSAQTTANSAQNKANSNAQTISTHTTQISALNTGLSAKVSQTDFNTLSGRVTSAENNITAKANELSSKITSVEGKIPTDIGTVNLVKGTGSAFVMGFGITNTTWNETKKQTILDFSVPGVRRDIGPEILPQNGKFFDFKPIKGTTYTQSIMIDTDATFNPNGQAKCSWFANGQHNHQKAYIKKVGAYSYHVWSTYTWNLENTALRAFDWYELHTVLGFRNSGTYLAFYKPKLTTGNLPSDWSPAPEDAINQISSLSSELKQTADGITLLATKTELNTAKNDLQSGISTATNKANAAQNTANSAQTTANSAQNKANSNAQTISTHTTQISALNTGLSAKVSQTDFNTLSGRVTTAENNIIAKANELSSKITSVEGKIPTSSGGRNLAQGTSKDWSKPFTGFSGVRNTCPSLYRVTTDGLVVGDTFKTRIVLKYTDIRPASGKTAEIWLQGAGNVTDWNSGTYPSGGGGRRSISGSGQIIFELTDKIIADHLKNDYWNLTFRTDWIASGSLQWKLVKAERGMFFTDWSPAPEDTIEKISSLSSELKQTADGITLLATKTELNTAKSDLQSGINTATNKANSAQSTANSNAQTISTHTTQISALNTGLQAKVSQTEFNTLSGRVTSAENNITAKANELSSKITSLEGKLPSGEMNLVEYGRPADGYSPYAGAEYATHGFYYNGAFKMYIMKNTTTTEKFFWMNRFKVERNTDYTLFFKGFNNSAIAGMDVWFLKRVNGSTNDFDSAQILVGGRKLSSSKAEDVSVTFNTGNYDEGYLRFDNNGTTTAGIQAALYFGDVSVKKGKSNSGWSPSLAELASSKDLKTAQSEFKQTTDSIKASVSSLDSSTVKSSSLTINSDGIVMKAGKSTTDVANAIGSYFAVNQNAINLFSDKINVKGNMIVNGAITSDKIASKSINTAHLNGKIITADVISSNAVTASAIKAGAVTTDKMSANSINGDRIAAGTLDAAKIKAGSITASQIASGTITSNQIKAGGISSANIAAGAITTDKIAAGAIDASKIAANAITANMITGGKLNSTNGATSFDLNAGTLTFNNNYGYIQRVSSDKVFEITTVLGKDAESKDFLTSDFAIRKSDNSRRAGAKFTLYSMGNNKPTARATIHADELVLFDSQNTTLLSILSKGSFSNFNFQGWEDIPVAQLPSVGLMVKDIGIGGHTKSLLKIVEELCKKTGILWF